MPKFVTIGYGDPQDMNGHPKMSAMQLTLTTRN